MAKGHILTEIHKRVVYQQLALGKGNKAIADFVKQEFGVIVAPQNFNHYRKHKQVIAKAYEEIRENITEHFPLTKLARKLSELEAMYTEADTVGEIDPEEYCKQFDNAPSGEKFKLIVEMASKIRKSATEKIRLKMDLLTKITDLTEPLKLEVTHKGAEDASLPRLKNVPTDQIKALMAQYEKAAKG